MRLPDNKQRIVIVGRTGSGKTVAGVWHLSNMAFDTMPVIIFDYKGDELIAQLGAEEIGPEKVPKNPGLYVIRPQAEFDDDEVEMFFWKVKDQGNVGLYIDEGYMLPMKGRSMAYQAIQTQGRSLRIPTITLSQRPVWMSRFVFSEADFYQVFHLNDKRDRKTIQAFLPETGDERLPDYHSYYYDVGKDDLVIMRPVPTGDEIIQKVRAKLPEKKHGLFT